MDKESWILPEEALEYGFATGIEKTAKKAASQNAKMRLLDIIKAYRQETDTQEADGEENPDNEEGEDTEGDQTDGEEAEDDENPEGEPTDEDGKESEKKAENSISKFFNAILKM